MANLNKLLRPRTIVVIGASNDADIPRGRFVTAILSNRFDGQVYLVSRSASEIMGRKTFAHVRELPEPADLAAVLVPAAAVAGVLEDCADAGITAAIVVASGFSEEGGEVAIARQRALADLAARRNMAIMGPNSLGFADFTTSLAATFSPVMETRDPPLPRAVPETARISVLAQSGAIGFGLVDNALSRGIPIARVISTGNEDVLDLTDYLDHFLAEGDTDVFLLYVESIRRPAAFAKFAREALEAGKPIVAIKVGRSEAGQRATISHTGAVAGSSAGWDALCWRYGIVQARDLDEAVDLASCFVRHHARLPRGRRVGIAASSGGGGVCMADICTDHGLEVVPLDRATRDTLDDLLPDYASSANPVDTTAQVIRDKSYSQCCRILADSPVVDVVIAVATLRTTSALGLEDGDLEDLGAALTKPVVFWSYTPLCAENVEKFREVGIPVAATLRTTARAVAAMADYAETRVRHAAGVGLASPVKNGRTLQRVAVALRDGAPHLYEFEAMALLADYGVPREAGRLVTDCAAAGEAVRELARPAVLKIQSPDIVHKTEAGGVVLNVQTLEAAETAFARIMDGARAFQPDATICGVLVQPMAPPGVEVILGASVDAGFGPLVMVGIGGLFVEVFRDIAFAPAPLDSLHARHLLEGLEGWPVLQGVRGEGAADVEALVELMVQVSHFVADHAEAIVELDLNPVIVHPEGEGVTVADALIVCATPECG
jgi:acyl-CoA synthetase (NDP forming)